MKPETIKRLRAKYCQLYFLYFYNTQWGAELGDYERGMQQYKILLKVAAKLKEGCTNYSHRQFTFPARHWLKDRACELGVIVWDRDEQYSMDSAIYSRDAIYRKVVDYIEKEGWRN